LEPAELPVRQSLGEEENLAVLCLDPYGFL
jgi:hypothetical protein